MDEYPPQHFPSNCILFSNWAITFNIRTPPVEDQISIGAKRPIFPEEVLRTEIPDGMNCHICLSRRVMRFFQLGLRISHVDFQGGKVIFPEGVVVKAIFPAG